MLWSIFALLGMLFSGVLVGVALGVTGILILYFHAGGVVSLQPAVMAAWNLLYNFALSALPLYILLGNLLRVTGLAERAYSAMTPLMERFPGKLLLTNVVICALFAAVVGSSMATAATVGAIAYPELRKRGYNRKALVGNLAGAGTLGSFIPPSLGLIIYGSWVGVSVGSCFMAALFPGLITAALFMIYVVVYCKMRADIVPSTGEVLPLKQAVIVAINVWPIIILIISIMGTIYFGVATPTEAAGLAVIAAIILSIGFRSFNFRKIYDAVLSATGICGMILFIMVGATIFSISVSSIGLPRALVTTVETLGLSRIAIIGFIYVLYLVLGCFFEGIAIILMTIPFTFPLMMSIGVDPYWFSVVLIVTGEMGLLTPPVGMNLYVLQAVSDGEVSLGEVALGSVPYFLVLGFTLFLITVFPQLCTWLPAQMK